MLATMVVAWAMLVWAMRWVSLHDSRAILFFGIGFRLVALGSHPVMEDDHHRFLWDGYRFATTGDPYAMAPQASFSDASVPTAFREILDRINHPDVPTIYGPACQWVFRLCHAVAPGELWPWKLVLLGAELALIGMLWRDLPARGRLVLAWCPLAIFETGFNAHPDVLAITLVVAAWWLGRRGRIVSAGAIAGLAVAAKVFAVLLVPFLLWRLGRRAWLAAIATVLALYAPFWWSGSAADLAGLQAMAGEWEFNSSVHAIVAALTSPVIARAFCGIVFGAVWLGLFVRWNRKPASPCRENSLPPGEWVYGAFLLLSAVANPWYVLWLWPFVATRISATGIVVLAAVSLTYVTGLNLGDPTLGNFGHPGWLRPLEFGLIAGVAGWDWWQRKARPRTLTGRSRAGG
ncbi:MAG: glycosyltransferase family 87 protein [Opitutaceae bacterium]